MGSDIALNSLQKMPKKELGLGFDNLVKPDSLDMHSSVANGGIKAKFSNEINNDEFLNPLSTIKNLRLSNVNRVVIGNLNINSLPNKFNQLKELVLKHVDILVLTETKLDDSFPNSQFLVDGFSEPFRIDRNRSGGGVMIYVRDVIPSKLLTKHFFPNDIEGLFVELNFRKCKWLLLGTYHPPSQSDQYFFENVDKALDIYSYFDKILLTGDFNAEIHDNYLESFLYQHELKNLVKEKTCFKSISNPSCIDLFLTNNALSFQNTKTVSTGLSDFHKLVLTVLKTNIVKNKPREIQYRDYKYFDSRKFNRDMKDEFSREYVDSCSKFDEIFLKVLNRHAPLKKKMLRANHAPYVSKALRKAIMKRSCLENIYFKKQDNHSLRRQKAK